MALSEQTATESARPLMGRVRTVLVLGALSIFGPLSMDLYLPSLPELANHLDTTDALAQLTMSTCLVGLGAGQLIAGPISDRVGRRRPLIVGVALFTVLAFACALAPNIQVLIVLRTLQGLAGATGLVISLAIARDLYRGAQLARMLAMLTLVGSTAPVVAPMVGGQLAKFMDWRGIFLVLASVGVVLLAIAVFFVVETLPTHRRHARSSPREAMARFGALAKDRPFVWLVVGSGVAGAAFFSYLAMCSFVFQNEYEVTAEHFSWIFAGNAVAMLVGAQVGAVFVRRIGPKRMYLVGSTAGFLAVLLLLTAVLSAAPFSVVLAALIAVMFAYGLTGPNTNALALSRHGEQAGTAAAVMGSADFVVGPVVAPLASLGGTTAVVMASTMVAATTTAALIAWGVVRPLTRHETDDAHDSDALAEPILP